MKVAICIATHNRLDTTKTFIDSFEKQERSEIDFDLYVLDDGSIDGTFEFLTDHPVVKEVLIGDGNFFWAKSMSILQTHIASMNYDGFLLANDDVLLDFDALRRLSDHILDVPNRILIGSMKDQSNRLSYGGLVKIGKSFFRLKQTEPASNSILPIDSFVGNFAYIPRTVWEAIGFLNGRFKHHFSDVEYGIRSSKKKLQPLLLPGYFGSCERNLVILSYLEPQLKLLQRVRELNSRKSFPVADHYRFYRAIGGPLFPFYFLASYGVKLFLVLFPSLGLRYVLRNN